MISSQKDFIDSFLSTVTIKDSTIQNCVLDGASLQITASTLNFENMKVNNVSTSTVTLPLIKLSLDSHLYLNGTTLTATSAPFLNLLASTGDINFLTAINFQTTNYLMKFEQTTNATLADWTLKNLTVMTLIPIVFTDANIHSIRRMNLDTTYAIFFHFLRSRIGKGLLLTL